MELYKVPYRPGRHTGKELRPLPFPGKADTGHRGAARAVICGELAAMKNSLVKLIEELS